MDFYDEFYDGKNQSGSEIDQEEVPDVSEFSKSNGRLRFRANFNLPKKYAGEKISLSDFKKLRDREVSNKDENSKFEEEAYDYSINDLTGFDNINEEYSDFKNNIRLSDSISKKVEKYKEMEANFSIVDNSKIMDKMINDRERGENVKNQRKIWSDILAIRIFIQNVLKLCNSLPPTGLISSLNKDSKTMLDEIRKEILDLTLMNQELQMHLNRKNKRLFSTILNDSAKFGIYSQLNSKSTNKRIKAELEFWDKYNPVLDNTFEWCIDVCDEWKKNTQIGVQKNFKVLNQSLRAQLEQTLLNKEHALNKSRPNANSLNFIGIDLLRDKVDPMLMYEMNKNIYDDSDSFVSLLKEIISSKSITDPNLNSVSSSLLSKGKKTVNSVDRRASKGRKIRYVPIPKLENFMASSPSLYSNSHLPGADNEEFVDCIMKSLLLA
ncbi:Apoptosis-antagonizing transcription factor C-terminal family protein [Cryptosporidium meleagridis]|uniref:Apoptosis-antagonizing transcription factor C-terminal family protein n=1 Tax=Cryptosporidium meleagridis TaxID=93969 RepID=A0A2P4Z485_9CRYT|nr:Apoptosis-antagonizing transcription factor C-terminal family protein [Cryptosporidium meleagridis]